MSSLAKKLNQRFTTKQKIYIGIFILIFILQFFLPGTVWYDWIEFNPAHVCLLAISGLIFACLRRNKCQEKIDDKPLLTILSSDYTLSSSASLSLLSLFYAIVQGLLGGAAISFILQAIGSIGRNGSLFDLVFALVALLVLIIIRIIVEGISTFFRLSQDISKSVNRG